MESGNVYHDQLPPPKALSPEEAMADAIAKGRSAKTRLLDAHYPDDLTDQELVDGLHGDDDPPSGETPPDPNPLPVEDTTPPKVSNTTPSNGQTSVPTDSVIKTVFDEPVTDAQIVVKDAQGAEVAGNAAMDAADTTLTFTTSAPLTGATVYTAEVSAAKDYAGNQMAAHSWSFTTGGPDNDAPTVTGAEPGRDATNVSVNTAVKVTFSETVSEVQLTVKDPTDALVQGTIEAGNGNVEWTFTPASRLAAQTAYRVEVSNAKDVSGNVMAPYTWSFTTGTDTPPPVPGLVAAYGMNEGTGTSVADSSGQNNTGTAADTGWDPAGKFGEALSFNGTTSMVTIGDAPSLRLSSGMTLSAWVKPTSVTGWRTVVGKELASGQGASYVLYASNGADPLGWLQIGGQPSRVRGATLLAANTWSHLAVTYDGTTARLFVNGDQVTEVPLSGDLDDDGGAVSIGGNNIWGEFFSGLIDEVRIYNIAQSAAQIQTDMNTPIGASGPTPTPTPTTPPAPVPGLVAAYGMEQGAGTTVSDSSGQNNTGTAGDTSWDSAGKFGKALSFNGTTSMVTIGDAPSLRLTSGMTLSAWVKPTTLTDWRTVVMKDLSSGDGAPYGLYASDSNVPAGWLLTTEGEQRSPKGTTALPANTWSHLALTYNGATAKLYVNGMQAGQLAVTGDFYDDGGDVHIGGNNAWGEFFSGLIDEVRIYNIAQSSTQIQTDMNTPIGATATTSGAAQQLRRSAAADPTPAIEKLVVNGSHTVDGVTVASTLTPRLTTWLSAGRDGEAKVEVEVAHKPAKSYKTTKSKRLIWSGQATAKPGDSRVALQVPKDRLQAGQKVRWRARVTGAGSEGTWTDWHDLIVDTSEAGLRTAAVAAAPDPAVVKRQLPSGTAGLTPTLEFQQCYNVAIVGGSYLAPTPYSYCGSSGFLMVIWDESIPFLPVRIGRVWGRQLTYLQGTRDHRQFTVRKYISIDKIEGDKNPQLAFTTRWSSKRSADCSHNSATGMTEYYPVSQWKNASSRAEWHRSDFFSASQGEGYHQISDCTVNYALVVKHPLDGSLSSTPIYGSGTFRCDTSPQIKWYPYGGCVHRAGVPSFTMTRNDFAVTKAGDVIQFPNMYDHIKRALTPGTETYPTPGGKSYPDLTQPKKIPGGSWREEDLLTRNGYEPTKDGIRTTAKIICKNELKMEEGYDCDEFPFASTLQGAARATPPHNFSVWPIIKSENGMHGTVLNAWYQNNRILNNDPFWIDIQ
ncbi:LamG-like jellyroll fold domain-containing protein [Streptosporangium sp. NPDC002544]|uniref:LamG-like jellyroll fold domain-containing protein n=1 Tax=Streptosporangium sp. NPDC002544 TaxID=3154538 RepID=UPI003321E20A